MFSPPAANISLPLKSSKVFLMFWKGNKLLVSGWEGEKRGLLLSSAVYGHKGFSSLDRFFVVVVLTIIAS